MYESGKNVIDATTPHHWAGLMVFLLWWHFEPEPAWLVWPVLLVVLLLPIDFRATRRLSDWADGHLLLVICLCLTLAFMRVVL